MFKRRKTALVVLAMAAAAVFVLPASSASAATTNQSFACANSVTANFSQIEVATSGDDGLTSVAPAGATTTTGLSQSAAIPGAIFVAGYNLGLLAQGTNNIPANVQSKIEGTNTTQGIQTTNLVGGSPPNGTVTVSTTITDPDGSPGTGDESATDASFSVNYNDLSWTAGASGTINYRPAPNATSPPTDAQNSMRIQALIGGFLTVTFRCSPGTVAGENPGVITLEPNPAAFDTTQIVVPEVRDATGVVIVNGPVSSTKTSKSFVYKVSNVGLVPITLDFANDITGSVDVNGVETGTVSVNAGTKTLNPGASTRVKLVWSYDSLLATGDTVVFNTCVNVAGDIDTTNDCGSATATAK